MRVFYAQSNGSHSIYESGKLDFALPFNAGRQIRVPHLLPIFHPPRTVANVVSIHKLHHPGKREKEIPYEQKF